MGNTTYTTEASTIQVFSGYANKTTSRRIAAGAVSAWYRKAGTSTDPATHTVDKLGLVLDLMPYLKGAVVPGSLRFKIGTYTYIDRNGTLYHSINRATGAGVEAGTINYATGKAVVTSWGYGMTTFKLEAGLVAPKAPGVATVEGHTDVRPLKSRSFSITATALDGTRITATAAADGSIKADNVVGSIDLETGIYTLSFGNKLDLPEDVPAWETKLVDPSTLRYNAVSFGYMPLDADIIGLDPVRLPPDGRVPIFRRGTFAVVGHTAKTAATAVSDGQTIDCGRRRLSLVRVRGRDGKAIDYGYTADLDAGTLTFNDVAGYMQPVTIWHRVEDLAQVSDVQINGDLTFTRQLTHTFPPGSVVSSAMVAGDMRARVSVLFDQATWTGVWQDSIIGNTATATYNDVLAPILVKNNGALTERWALRLLTTSTFEVIGEHAGILGTYSLNEDCAPVNPATGTPYFVIRALGWGTGWSAGNVLRLNTIGALYPFWAIMAVQQGQSAVADDSFSLLARGDVGRD